MALLVTLFLVLVNIFNSVTGNAPKAEGLTAVETWVTIKNHPNILFFFIFVDDEFSSIILSRWSPASSTYLGC